MSERNGQESQTMIVDALEEMRSVAPAGGHAVHDYFGTDEIFQRVAASADEEFKREPRLLFLSGVAAGLSIGLSFIARSTITASVPGDTTGLVGNLLYPVGFLFIVMGRYQLFTENTLTPVTLVLTRIASLPLLLRQWGIVLAANLLGATILAFVLAHTGIFSPEAAAAAKSFGKHGLEESWSTLFFKAIIAGWIVAGMVWLIHAARDSITRFLTVFVMMFLVPSADLFHCIIGACEAMYLVFTGDANLSAAVFSFFTPVLLGNTVGGVLLVAILNFAQTRDNRFPNRDCAQLELTWREWLFEIHNGSDESSAVDGKPSRLVVPVQTDDHRQGADDAPITVVQYGDYECPVSLQIYLTAQECLGQYDDRLSYVFRHLPLSQRHPHAQRAAFAAEAAGAQGRFWEMHDALFNHQDALEEEDLLDYANQLGLDMEQFEEDINAEAPRERVQTDRQSAIQSGVRSTSNLFINEARYQNDIDVSAITKRLDYLLSRLERVPA